jgi:ATP-binding cassette subfamily B protein
MPHRLPRRGVRIEPVASLRAVIDPPPPTPPEVRREAWRLMREVAFASPRWIGIGVTVALGWTLAKIAIPLFALQAIDDGIDPFRIGPLLRWTGGIVLLTLITGSLTYVRRTAAFAVSLRAEAELRRRLFDHLQRLHFGYHDRAPIGELMARVSTDAKQVQMLLVFIPIAGANIVMIVGVTVVLFVLDAKLAAVAVATLPLLLVAATRFSSLLHPIAMGLQQRLAGVSHVVEESLSGIRVVKGFGAESLQNEHLATAADQVYERGMALARMRARYNPLLEVLPTLGLVGILYVGGRAVIDGELTIAALITFNFYILQLVFPLRMTSFMVAQISRAAASAARVHEILGTEPEVVEQKDARPLPDGGGELRFEHVDFAYVPGARVLRDFDLTIPAGQSVALVGATGAGKSTVARLVPRFYDVEAGRVLLDGVDVRDLRLSDLRDAVALVFEDTFLFTDSVRANVAFADDDADTAEVERAALLAGASEFIEHLPEGYDTVLGEHGFSLSGGQRQRVAIARAILADPRVLILDDATSSVDPTKEHEIRDALAEVMRGRTTIIIAHRPATIALADRVVLIEHGRVAATGTHRELLATSAAYRVVLAQAEHTQRVTPATEAAS